MQLLQSKSHSAFDRTQRHPRDLGDLPIRVTAVKSELDRLLLLDREARQRVTHRVPFHYGGDLPPRVPAGSGGGNPLCTFEGHLTSFMGGAAPKLIDGAVADGGQQPGTKGGPGGGKR